MLYGYGGFNISLHAGVRAPRYVLDGDGRHLRRR
jgi:hypothetical protein